MFIKTRVLICFSAIMMMSLVMSGCSPKQPDQPVEETKETIVSIEGKVEYPVEVVGYTDRVTQDIRETKIVQYQRMPNRVALADQSMTDIMIELGLTDKVIGISNITNPILPKYQAEYDKLNLLGDFSKTAQSVNDLGFPTRELMVAAEPDMIIGWSGLFYDTAIGTIAEWEEKNVHAFLVRNVADMGSTKSLDNNFQDIEDLGVIFDVQDRAEALLSPMRARLQKIEAIVSDHDERVVVLGLGLSNAGTYQVYGKGTLLADMIERAGGVVAETDARATLSNENLLELNPDFIIYMDYASEIKSDQDGVAYFQSIEALRTVTAVNSQQILVSPSTRCFNGSLESAEEVERFAQAFYPQLFQ